jgi:hypothetical protein
MPGRRGNHHGSRLRPDTQISNHALHDWWYARLADAGVVPEGTTKGERMHKARHTAGQNLLDATGNLKAVQKLLGHKSVMTTADVYLDWDVDRLAQSLGDMLEKSPASFPGSGSRQRKVPPGIRIPAPYPLPPAAWPRAPAGFRKMAGRKVNTPTIY